MTPKNRKEFAKRINKAKEMNIFVPEKLNPESKIRGIYGFFAVSEGKEECFYIGKSNNIFMRMFGKGSTHIYGYERGVRKEQLQVKMDNYLKEGKKIEVRVLEEVPFMGDSFAQDANRLALAELKILVQYQDNGFCLGQLSEAVKAKRESEIWKRR